MQVKHTWHIVPANRESLGHPPAGTTIDLYISVMPEWESALVDALSEVNNLSIRGAFSSPPLHLRLHSRVPFLRFRYGAPLSAEQVTELIMPHPDTRQLTNAWLIYHDTRRRLAG